MVDGFQHVFDFMHIVDLLVVFLAGGERLLDRVVAYKGVPITSCIWRKWLLRRSSIVHIMVCCSGNTSHSLFEPDLNNAIIIVER